MEAGPVDPAIVTFEHVLNDGIGLSEQVRGAGILQVVFEPSGTGSNALFPKPRYVPDSDCLIEGCRDDYILGGMELRAHHVMVVAGKDADASPTLPVPNADGLVVGCAEDPGILVMEHRGSDVVEMTEKREDASTLFVVPYFDLVVVTSGHEQWLLIVEADPTHRAVVLVEFVQQCAHPVVPQLDNAIVQTVKKNRDPDTFAIYFAKITKIRMSILHNALSN